MYLLDTNVVSEFRKLASGRADPHVQAWAAKIDSRALHISVVTVLEIEIGILRLDRRDEAQAMHLRRWLWDEVVPSFKARLLDVDIAIAKQTARSHVPNRRPTNDALIAATAVVHGLCLVTEQRRKDHQPLGSCRRLSRAKDCS